MILAVGRGQLLAWTDPLETPNPQPAMVGTIHKKAGSI